MKRDWKRVVAEYRASGVSQAEFCRSRGINLSSLTYQLKRAESISSFVRIDAGERIELELPGGVILRVSERNLMSVLKALQA